MSSRWGGGTVRRLEPPVTAFLQSCTIHIMSVLFVCIFVLLYFCNFVIWYFGCLILKFFNFPFFSSFLNWWYIFILIIEFNALFGHKVFWARNAFSNIWPVVQYKQKYSKQGCGYIESSVSLNVFFVCKCVWHIYAENGHLPVVVYGCSPMLS